MNQIHFFATTTCAPQTINRTYVDFPAQMKKSMQRRFVCVVGLAIFGSMFQIWVLIAHGLKSAYKTVFVLVERMWVGAWNPHSMFCI